MHYLLELSSSANPDRNFGCPNCQKTVFCMSKRHAGRKGGCVGDTRIGKIGEMMGRQ